MEPETIGQILNKMPTPAVRPKGVENTTIPQRTLLETAVYNRRGILSRHIEHRDRILEFIPAANVFWKLDGALASGFLFILCGPKGTGKTQIATDLACDEVDRMYPLWKSYPEDAWPMYTTARTIFGEIRATFNRESEMSEVRILRRFSEPHLLVIDEAQERGNTEWEDRTLTDIIDRRYGMMRDTIIISNLTRAELPAALGPSIISRLHETGEVIECTWASFREKKS